MFFMHWGWLKKPVFDPPYVGVFLEGFLTNGDWRTILVCALQLVLAIAIYWPFFKIMEREELSQESEKTNKSIEDIVADEDLDILAGLELDF